MKSRFFLVLGIGAVLAVVLWNKSDPVIPSQPRSEESSPLPAAVETDTPPEVPAGETPAPMMPRTEESRASSRRDLANPLVASSFHVAPRLSEPEPSVAAELDQVSLMLRDYRTLTGGNPEGTNAEIMKAIMGGNPKGAMLGPPEGQSVNESGELIDRWGTPYFFHQLTRDLMEIRSAGPDGRMWNDDDIIGP